MIDLQLQNAIVPVVLAVIIICVVLLVLFVKGSRRNNAAASGAERAEQTFYRIAGRSELFVAVVYDAATKVPLYVSENTETLLGIPRETVQYDLMALTQCLDHAELRKLMADLQTSNRQITKRYELPYTNLKNNQAGWMALSFSPDASGHIVLMMRDVTEDVTERQSLSKQIVEAKSAEQAKAEFLSNMSHEIRTPMNGISGTAELMRLHLNEPQVISDYLDQIDDLSDYLLSLINNVLDMSKVESGKMELASECFDILEVMRRQDELFRKQVEGKGVEFVYNVEEFPDHYLLGDDMRISQILANLLSNSYKFTSTGSVTLSLRLMQVSDDGLVHFMMGVSDTGKGMSPAFLTRIFSPFVQEDASISRKYGGTGLGMAITDSMTKLMGGEVVVESEEGKGSSFSVYLGLPRASASQIAAYEKELAISRGASDVNDFDFKGAHILLAEDNNVNVKIAKAMFENQGAIIQVARDGVEAVQAFEEAEPFAFDIIFMDIQMPNLDGWEATKQIRALDRADAAVVPIFAMSANAFVEDIRHSNEVGMTGHISKPINFDGLGHKITQEIAEASGTQR